MSTIVFIPGLGADARLFSLLKPEYNGAVYVNWKKPGSIQTLREYLPLISEQVKKNSDPVILVGVSLGGMLAMEWRELFPVSKTILISSIKCAAEMPIYMRMFRRGNAYRLVKPAWLKRGASLVKPFISDVNNKPAMELFNGMLTDADDEFISWAIGQALNWGRTTYNPEHLVHIHGTSDHLFPIRNIKNPDYIVKGGTHDMVLSKADEISRILKKELEDL